MQYAIKEDSRRINAIKKDIVRTEMIIKHTKKTVSLKQNQQKLRFLNHALKRAIWERNRFELFEFLYEYSLILFKKETERFGSNNN